MNTERVDNIVETHCENCNEIVHLIHVWDDAEYCFPCFVKVAACYIPDHDSTL